jgi:hypothetical protein
VQAPQLAHGRLGEPGRVVCLADGHTGGRATETAMRGCSHVVAPCVARFNEQCRSR